jgi:hypothetical protein
VNTRKPFNSLTPSQRVTGMPLVFEDDSGEVAGVTLVGVSTSLLKVADSDAVWVRMVWVRMGMVKLLVPIRRLFLPKSSREQLITEATEALYRKSINSPIAKGDSRIVIENLLKNLGV